MLGVSIGDRDGRSRCRLVETCLKIWLHLMEQDGGIVPEQSSPCTHHSLAAKNFSVHSFGAFLVVVTADALCRSSMVASYLGLQVASDGVGRWQCAKSVLPLHIPCPSSLSFFSNFLRRTSHRGRHRPLKLKKSCHLSVTPMILFESKGHVGRELRWRVR